MSSPGMSLRRYPFAPARIASKRSDSSSLMVSMTMRLDGTDSLMARQASIPVCLGIRTSMRTTSGSSSSARRSASTPSPASPTTSIPSSACSTISRPRRNTTWPPATRTLTGAGWPLGSTLVTAPERASRSGLPPLSKPPMSGIIARRRPWLGSAGRRPDRGGRLPVGGSESPLRGGQCLGVVDLQVDHAVGPAPPPVDDARLAGVGVVEEVEVVADELHLVERVLERHRRTGVDLLAYLDRRLTHCTEGPVGGRCHWCVLRTRPGRGRVGTTVGEPAGRACDGLRHASAGSRHPPPVGGAT